MEKLDFFIYVLANYATARDRSMRDRSRGGYAHAYSILDAASLNETWVSNLRTGFLNLAETEQDRTAIKTACFDWLRVNELPNITPDIERYVEKGLDIVFEVEAAKRPQNLANGYCDSYGDDLQILDLC